MQHIVSDYAKSANSRRHTKHKKRTLASAGVFFIFFEKHIDRPQDIEYTMHMENKRSDNKRRFNAWLDADLLKTIQKMAEEQNRTVTNMIEVLLLDAVKSK